MALLAVAGIAVVGWVVMLLWNWLLPAVFAGAQPVGYWQALGILLLSRILFGGLRGSYRGDWRSYSQRRESMTPEEREQLKSHFRSRWSCWCGPSSPDKRDDGAPKDDPSRPE
jgi:hypothetical protein